MKDMIRLINTCLGRLKQEVLSETGKVMFPSSQSEETIKGISVWMSEKIENDLSGIGAPGICLKEKKFEPEYYGAKQFDILLSINVISAHPKGLCTETVAKSILTHEFMHAISIGYAKGDVSDIDRFKDEAYTDHLARKLFNILYPDEFYFTSYPSLDIEAYDKVDITDEGIQCYFKGGN